MISPFTSRRDMHVVLFHLLIVCLSIGSVQAEETGTGAAYSVIELSFTGPMQTPVDSPARDVDFWVRFTHESGNPEYKIHGFWDGDGKGDTSGNVFKIRFCPTKTGKWYLSEVYSNRAELHGQKEGDYLTSVASSSRGFWIVDKDSAGGRWFKRSDGSHQYVVGNTHYDFLSRPNGREASASTIRADVIDSSKYFKKLRFCLISPRGENASSLLAPFIDTDGDDTHGETDRPNPKFYFERVDPAVQTGLEKDFICDLILGGTTGTQVVQNEAYLKYVVARYGAYPNVWITTGQEWNEDASASHEKDIGNFLRSLMAYPTPMSTHGTTGWDSSLNGTWHTHSIRQEKTGSMSEAAYGVNSDYAANGNKPAVNDEVGYDPNEATTPEVIEGSTGCFLGGGYATTGHKTASKEGGYFWGHAAQGKSIGEHPSCSNMGFLRAKIDQYITFWKMSPVEIDRSIFSGGDSAFRVLEWPGNEYVLGSNSAQSGVMANLPPGLWSAVQLDIISKMESTLGTNISGSYTFDTPASRAVLTIFRRSGGSISPPANPKNLRVTEVVGTP